MLKRYYLIFLLFLLLSCSTTNERNIPKELDTGHLVLVEDNDFKVIALKAFQDLIITKLEPQYNISLTSRIKGKNFMTVKFSPDPLLYNENITLYTFHKYKESVKYFTDTMKTIANDCAAGYRQQILTENENEIILLEDCRKLKNNIGAKTSLHRIIKSKNNLHLLSREWYNLDENTKAQFIQQKLSTVKDTIFCGQGLYNMGCLDIIELF